jgi:O-antigen ligase
MLFTVVLTSSNGGLIATCVGLAIFLGFSLNPSQTLKAVPLLLLPVLFLLAGGVDYLPQTFHERVLVALTTGDVSAAGTFEARNELMHEALNLIDGERVSWLGIGADQFRLISAAEAPVHNSFLLLWAEGGIVSFLGWLMFCSIGLIVWAVARSRGLMPYGRSAVLASFAVFLIITNVSAHIYARYWYAVLLIIMQPTLIELSKQFVAGRRRLPPMK